MNSAEMKRIALIASGGGHWVQLNRLLPAFEGNDLFFVTVNPAYREDVQGHRFYTVVDATRWNKFKLLWMCLQLAFILIHERPDFVVSTGAAPGYFGILIGRLLGAKTVWIDSIANVEAVSLSGQRIGRHADLWLTQWEHLAQPNGPQYAGEVI